MKVQYLNIGTNLYQKKKKTLVPTTTHILYTLTEKWS